MSDKQSVVIVGAGRFWLYSGSPAYRRLRLVALEALCGAELISGIYGMSTALWMLREGGYEVTILDRCEELPALDAASTGMSPVHLFLIIPNCHDKEEEEKG